jgi:hypothetical protein
VKKTKPLKKTVPHPVKETNNPLIWRNCVIGAPDAETDQEMLSTCYVDNGCLEAVRDISSSQAIILGRTGAGKSATLIRLAQVESNVIAVDPLDLAFRHIENSTIIGFFRSAGVNLDLFYRLLWRHVLITELLKYRYQLRDQTGVSRWFEALFARIKGDQAREKSLRYLRQWGDQFWLATETRMREVTSKIEQELHGSISSSIALSKAEAGASAKLSDSERAEVFSRGSAIVNNIQLRELTQLLDFLAEEVFDDPQKHYFLTIDKLDEDWVTSLVKSKMIRALIEEVKTFRKITNAKIIVVLRDDLLEKVYDETRDGGFQQEKYEAYYARVKWRETELVELIRKRVNEVYRHKYAKVEIDLKSLFPSDRKGQSALPYIFERTFFRPRDVISYVNLCLALAEDRPRISWQVIHEAEEKYSKGRLKSLFDEWLARFPSLQRVSEMVVGLPETFTRSAFSEMALNDLAANIAEKSNNDEVGRLCENLLSTESRHTLADLTSAILKLLYHVGVIGVKMSPESPRVWSYRDGEDLSYGDMKRASSFRVHKMFWRALRIKTNDIWIQK